MLAVTSRTVALLYEKTIYIYTHVLCVYEQLNKLRDPAVLNTQLYACVQPYIDMLR